MPYDINPPNTGDELAAMAPEALRKLYQAGLDAHEQTEDPFHKLEGKGKDAVIQTVTDFEASGGVDLTIRGRTGFYGEGKRGDELFEGPEDFEQDGIYATGLRVDFIRNAHSMTQRVEELLAMRNEIRNGSVEELGKWMGRTKADEQFFRFFYGNGQDANSKINLVVAGSHSTQDGITSADVLNWDTVTGVKSDMQPNGGVPAKVAVINGVPVHRYIVMATTPGLFSLEVDPEYKDALKSAGQRGSSNPLFSGEYTDIRGNIIMPFNPINHDGVGPIGSKMNALAYLGNAIAPGTGIIAVTGGGNPKASAMAKINFFKYFDGFAYRFIDKTTLAQSPEEKYFLIVNPSNAPTDPNKIGMYAYTVGNNGNKITITKRLGPADSAAQAQKVGDVVWNTGVWANRHTQTHPEGAVIVQCNAKGVPIGDTLVLGARAAYRGYGKFRNARTQQDYEGGFVTQRFITTVFGTKLRTDALKRARGFMRIRHAIQYAGLPIPTNIV